MYACFTYSKADPAPANHPHPHPRFSIIKNILYMIKKKEILLLVKNCQLSKALPPGPTGGFKEAPGLPVYYRPYRNGIPGSATDILITINNFFVVVDRLIVLSYLTAVTITDNRAANLDLCLALTVSSSESSFTCHTYCDTGPPFCRSYPNDPVILTSECRALGK
jgi:hypothetical protein